MSSFNTKNNGNRINSRRKNEKLGLEKRKLVFTNGCFDILHVGHIKILERCRKLAGKNGLVLVAVNSDESIKRLKGNNRPYNKENDRVKILQSLKFVDMVVVFNEDTPYTTIKLFKPDIIVKGGDYKKENVIGNNLAKVIIVPSVKNRSTSKILEKLKNGI